MENEEKEKLFEDITHINSDYMVTPQEAHDWHVAKDAKGLPIQAHTLGETS